MNRIAAKALAIGLLAVAWGGASASAQSEPGKKWRESRIKVPEVTYDVSIEPKQAKPGETVTYKVAVKVASPWHIYAWASEQPSEGPRSTQFNLYETGGLTLGNEWKPDHAPELAKEPAFPNLEAVAFHENGVVWAMPLTVPKNATAGSVTIKGQMLFQICNEGACKPPTTVALPDVVLSVVD